ncbi:MAG TPA: nitroreductase [Micromonosporaceae bacterium]
MELIDAVRSRRSVGRLVDPAPSDEEILDLVTEAATGPDHGLLRPWRLITVRGDARRTLGEAFAADLPDDDAAGRERAAGKPLRAPLLLSIVLEPRENPKVPEWEQLAATAAMVHNLSLLLHAGGWGAMWRTGAPVRSPHVHKLLGLSAGEQLLGWLYVGTPRDANLPPRPPFDPRDRIYALDPTGTVEPLAVPTR